jgi:hypothetical protein
MSHHNKNILNFYFPNARVLGTHEVAALPAEKKKAAEATGKSGIWLEVDCPDGSCVGKDGRVTLEAVGTEVKKDKGVWLNVFCPEDSCLWKSGTDLA